MTGGGTNSWTVAEKMGTILRDLNVQSLLSISVTTDLEDSSQHILKVSIITIFSDLSTIFLSRYVSKSSGFSSVSYGSVWWDNVDHGA